jgi:hypothetical protein
VISARAAPGGTMPFCMFCMLWMFIFMPFGMIMSPGF